LFGYQPKRFISDGDGTSFLSPISYQCVGCAKTKELFNAKKHGYGIEFRGSSNVVQGTGKPDQYPCPKCSGATFSLQCGFIYPDALFDLIQDDIEEGAGLGYGDNVQNKFDQFWAKGTCLACKEESSVASLEVK